MTALRIPASWIAVAAFFFLVALPRPAIPLIDGDVWWHIRAGREMLSSGSVPRVDSWSIVGAGMPWTSQDWLSNVALALGYGAGEIGPTLLSIGWALLVVAALALLWSAIGFRVRAVGWLGRILLLAAGLVVSGPTLGVRVQVVDLTLAAAAMAVLWHYQARRNARWLVALPVLAVAWANLHAGWPLLFLLGGALVVGEGADRLVRRRLGPAPLSWRELGWLCAALVVALAAISVNPNGPALYLYPLETSGISAHRAYLAEWQAPNVGTFVGQVYLGFLALVVLPTLWISRRRMRAADLLILLGVVVMGAAAARFLLIAGPIGAAVAALYLAPALAGSRPGRRMGPTLARLAVPRPDPRYSALNATLIGLVAAAGVTLAVARVSPSVQAESIAGHMPVDAVEWIRANDPGSRPFNVYAWGGYLGHMRPTHPVFIDGRSDIYGDEPIRRYAATINLETDPQAVLDRHEIDHVLFQPDQPLAEWLDASEAWRQAYADDVAVVWVRSGAD
ncbi:MAG: hypothetical protein ACRDGV_06340 [Candidatus Limnocylindria bacterium]